MTRGDGRRRLFHYEDHYKAFPVEDEGYYWNLRRYIHLNPSKGSKSGSAIMPGTTSSRPSRRLASASRDVQSTGTCSQCDTAAILPPRSGGRALRLESRCERRFVLGVMKGTRLRSSALLALAPVSAAGASQIVRHAPTCEANGLQLSIRSLGS